MQNTYTNNEQHRHIEQSISNWLKAHDDMRSMLLAWADTYLRNNPCVRAEIMRLHPTADAIVDYLCSNRPYDETLDKIRKMKGAWRVYRYRFRKHTINVTIDEISYNSLKRACSEWGISTNQLIEDLLKNVNAVHSTVKKEENIKANKKIEEIKNRHELELEKIDKKHQQKIRKLENQILNNEHEKTLLIKTIRQLKSIAENFAECILEYNTDETMLDKYISKIESPISKLPNKTQDKIKSNL